MRLLLRLRNRVRQPVRLLWDLRLLRNRLSRPQEVTIAGIRVPLGEHLTPYIRDTLYAGSYEYEEVRLLRRHLAPHHTVVELGGGLGFLAALCARVVSDERVFVYEANPDLEAPMRELFRLNGIEPRLRFLALGSGDGQMRFHVRRAFWLSSGLENELVGPDRIITVPVLDFDAEMERLPTAPDFLICDIEGGEYELFKGSAMKGIRHILCEVHPHLLGAKRTEALEGLLRDRGFRRVDASRDESSWYLERS